MTESLLLIVAFGAAVMFVGYGDLWLRIGMILGFSVGTLLRRWARRRGQMKWIDGNS